MHILIFIYSMGDGGAERVTANLSNYWADKGFQITIVTLEPVSFCFYDLNPTIKLISLEMANASASPLIGAYQNVRRVMALRKVLNQVQPDIALGKMTAANIVLALASWCLPNLRTVGAEHTYPGRRCLTKLWETLRRHTYGSLNAVTALTSEGKLWLENNTNAKNVLVIPNSVTWPLPDIEPHLFPDAVYKSERKLLLAVGRFNPVKAFDILIEAFAKVADKHPNWDLNIVGEGKLRSELEAQIEKLNLKNRVLLPGRAGNIGQWYEAADLYVLSSHHEGFPMTLVEAMAYGIAAVSFDCDTGPRDIIRHEVDGLLVKPGNSEEMAMALDRLMGDDLLRTQFSDRAVEVRDRFTIDKITSMWEKLFTELLSEK